MLHTVVNDTGRTAYCGPTAISALTGVPISRIEKMLRRAINDRRAKYGRHLRDKRKFAIKGTFETDVVTVLKRLGCSVQQEAPIVKTFQQFVADRIAVKAAYLVEVTGHFMAAFGGYFADTAYPTPAPLGEYSKGKRRVVQCWRVIAPAPKLGPAPTPVARPKKDRNIVAERAGRIVAQIDQWEAKEKRARNALKKLRAKRRYYERKGVL